MPGENSRHCRSQFEFHQSIPTGRAAEGEEFVQSAIDRLQSEVCVGDDREGCDENTHQGTRGHTVAEPEPDEGDDGEDGNDLQQQRHRDRTIRSIHLAWLISTPVPTPDCHQRRRRSRPVLPVPSLRGLRAWARGASSRVATLSVLDSAAEGEIDVPGRERGS